MWPRPVVNWHRWRCDIRAVIFEDKGKVGVSNVPDPGIQTPDDVVVEVAWTAICGSDMHVYHGRESGLDAGTVMGHEFTGTVCEVGESVTDLKPGDRVYSPFTTSCGRCEFCRSGLTSRCRLGELFGWVEAGRGLHGAQAEYVRVPLAQGTLVKLPDDIDPEAGLLMGDVLSTGYFCAQRGDIPEGGTAAVIGCGPVGLMAVIGARECGAERVFALDSVAERLERARAFGAEPVAIDREGYRQAILEATGGLGVDAVLEAVGSESATQTAIELVKPGGTISMVGVHTATHFGLSPSHAYDKNLTLRIGRCPARFYMPRLVDLVRSSRYDLTSIITHRFKLERGEEAYRWFDRKQDGCLKILLKP